MEGHGDADADIERISDKKSIRKSRKQKAESREQKAEILNAEILLPASDFGPARKAEKPHRFASFACFVVTTACCRLSLFHPSSLCP
jgi:hypothetical protein